VLVATVIGVLFDLAPKLRPLAGLVAFAGLVAALVWLGWNRLGDFGWNLPTAAALFMTLGGVIVVLRLSAKAGDDQTAGIVALVYAFGAGTIALIGNSASLAQLCFAATAAIGGFMLWNWPVARFPFGLAAIFGVVGGVAAMSIQMALFTRASVPALLLLSLVVFADLAAKPFQPAGGAMAKALGPVILGIVAAIIAGAAIGLARFLDTSP